MHQLGSVSGAGAYGVTGTVIKNIYIICLVLAAGAAAPSLACAGSPLLEAYGEFVTLESEGGYQSSTWATARWRTGESAFAPMPYVGLAWERYAPDFAPNVSQVGRVSPHAGVQFRPIPEIKLFAEYRYVFDSPRSAIYSRHDPRIGVVGGLWRELALGKHAIFSDSYGEFLFLPRISDRPAATVFSKVGPRFRLVPRLGADLYLEGFARESDDVNLGRRAYELRYGSRLVYAFGGPRPESNWVATLGAFRRFASFRDAPAARWRLLIAIGGSL
jgi:hypothetical protein